MSRQSERSRALLLAGLVAGLACGFVVVAGWLAMRQMDRAEKARERERIEEVQAEQNKLGNFLMNPPPLTPEEVAELNRREISRREQANKPQQPGGRMGR